MDDKYLDMMLNFDSLFNLWNFLNKYLIFCNYIWVRSYLN